MQPTLEQGAQVSHPTSDLGPLLIKDPSYLKQKKLGERQDMCRPPGLA